MRDWALTTGDPLSLCIAADARLCHTNYGDDQIWELRLAGGEPACLALETTYGLRARAMRIFPAFQVGEQYRLDPATFAQPPQVRRFLPNYLRVDFSPLAELQARAEYWVPESNQVGGRITLHNLTPETLEVQLVLHALLRPGGQTGGMSAVLQEGVMVLAGRTGDLAPVVFIAGGAAAAAAAFPALRLTLVLEAGGSEAVQWAHAGSADPVRSHQLARELAVRSWDAEIARLERANASLVELETGNPNWDAALAFSQNAALAGYLSPTRYLPHPSFVLVRAPDHGYSARGDGRDYDLFWDGQSAVHAYVNVLQLLPAAPELAKGVLLNFLEGQTPEGGIDGKLGLGGQRAGGQSAPLLAGLSWQVYRWTEDADFLAHMLPGLLRFFESWFDPDNDQDQDGHPEWHNTLQSGFDDWPAFVRWRSWGQGLDVRTAETPDLAAYLYREASALQAMCEVLGEREQLPALEMRAEALCDSLERSWSEAQAGYLHLDRELHHSAEGEQLGQGQGRFTLEVGREFDPPTRVVVRSRARGAASPALRVLIRGIASNGRRRVGRLDRSAFSWFSGLGTATSALAFRRIDRIEVQGPAEGVSTTLRTADYSRADHTGLLPLWAMIPTSERADRLVHGALLDPERFWRQHGIPGCSAKDPAYTRGQDEGSANLRMLWNLMLGEGLLAYGYRQQAAELVGRLLDTCAGSLRRDRAFRESYHAELDQGSGSRHHLAGIGPLSLFLQVMGVQLISPHKVRLRGANPFPTPVRLRWRKLEIEWEGGRARVQFPDGTSTQVEGEAVWAVEQGGDGFMRQSREKRSKHV